jgi:hypothetical protein
VFILGIDPDLHDMALALVWVDNGHIDVRDIRICHVPARATKTEAVHETIKLLSTQRFDAKIAVIENQFYRHGSASHRKSKPEDLINLAWVAGAAAMMATLHCDTLLMPQAQEWKGSVPKPIHQARILAKLNSLTSLKEDFPHVKESQWVHALDAIGMALWGAQRFATNAAWKNT